MNRLDALLTITILAGATCGPPPVGNVPLVEGAQAPPGFFHGPLTETAPTGNALTEAKGQLGRRLFYDKRLSRDKTVACSSCHQQAHAFADPRRVSEGVDRKAGNRNAPALVNLAWGTSFFWDGRAKTLEDQAGKPIENPLEMDLALGEAVARVSVDELYVQLFHDAFRGPVSELTLRQALASFVRTLASGGSRYDRYVGGDLSALTDQEKRGEMVFLGEKGRCFHCHPSGPLTNDGFFHNGTFVDGGDTGRQMITANDSDRGKFRVPGLRNIAVTAPYMHDGSLATLEEVIDQYAKGGKGQDNTDPLIRPLSLLTLADKADLLAFLRSMTDQAFLHDARFARPESLPPR